MKRKHVDDDCVCSEEYSEVEDGNSKYSRISSFLADEYDEIHFYNGGNRKDTDYDYNEDDVSSEPIDAAGRRGFKRTLSVTYPTRKRNGMMFRRRKRKSVCSCHKRSRRGSRVLKRRRKSSAFSGSMTDKTDNSVKSTNSIISLGKTKRGSRRRKRKRKYKRRKSSLREEDSKNRVSVRNLLNNFIKYLSKQRDTKKGKPAKKRYGSKRIQNVKQDNNQNNIKKRKKKNAPGNKRASKASSNITVEIKRSSSNKKDFPDGSADGAEQEMADSANI